MTEQWLIANAPWIFGSTGLAGLLVAVLQSMSKTKKRRSDKIIVKNSEIGQDIVGGDKIIYLNSLSYSLITLIAFSMLLLAAGFYLHVRSADASEAVTNMSVMGDGNAIVNGNGSNASSNQGTK